MIRSIPSPIVWISIARLLAGAMAASPATEARLAIESGRWIEAARILEQQLGRSDLDFPARQELLFEQERMGRIRLDFSRTHDQVVADIRGILPDAAAESIARWEADGALESWRIDGSRFYFQKAAANLFRVHPEARRLSASLRAPEAGLLAAVSDNIDALIAAYGRTGQLLGDPYRARIRYTLTVKPDMTPPGENIRAWLPFPRQTSRQRNLRLVTTRPSRSIPSGAESAHSTLYLEQSARQGLPTTFEAVFEYTVHGCFRTIDPARVRLPAPGHPEASPHMGERPPHIVFTPELRALAADIAGGESNPWLQAKRYFAWISDNIPWASAREYSTIPSLTEYALRHRWGDCGIQTMLFMSLCRLSGIPARWESGWTTGRNWNMHDWCAIYLEPYGWLPVDVSHGLLPVTDERRRWFYCGNIDSQRLVVNHDFAQPLYPAKTFFRSETVDFQRGEVEWRGGNLYYPAWAWRFEPEIRQGATQWAP
ncbi:MAG TPA: transglutaminase-like domain-containing protein [Candidatus Paceibacterota bacterium]|nr:transglutaminase-like domain-containing protein [Verrucomicrobiota bacterium]HRZ46885.1 transglutaminase-like domain-containing protein [Candidatus Paceibacterota bacterium]HRZ92494.1 transglutaminase-like domain-containing protein [Candidatus Paceibacterota bacterium]